MKPIIGIGGNHLAPTAGCPMDKTYTPQGFIDGVQAAGGIAFVIPISDPLDAEHYVNAIDGLILAGGQDVSPIFYDEEPTHHLGATHPERDTFEIALVKEAYRQCKPIFAVCRGMQIVNVAFGGTLHQDIRILEQFPVQHDQKTNSQYASHSIAIAPNSFLSSFLGESHLVNSFHHQAVKDLADLFEATAWSADGLIEAFETKDKNQSILAVQWHPELMLSVSQKMQYFFDEIVFLAGTGIHYQDNVVNL